MNLRRLAFIATCLVALAACGNKGPLFLPQKPAPVQEPLPAPPEPAGTPAGTPTGTASGSGNGTPR